ncbi:uncharacterized protein LOC122093070 [Macadamia integrifolia]|uniref:uncharacterized protein LOC122093070 n=1 Tax=Macadamia integrifolia TaxID=60698 RepID=UPI001C52B630|nr:uncharacterized protein LOC122093070 [Macadamia integrifolia]
MSSSLDYRGVDDDLLMKMMESSSEKSKKLRSSCCRCCLGFTFTVSLTALLLWLSMIPSAPVIYLSDFCFVDITGAGNSTVVHIELIPKNTNMVKEIYYDHFDVSLTYYNSFNDSDTNLINPRYNDSASGFHQGYPLKDHFRFGRQYRPNVTISSESEDLKHELRSNLPYVHFYVEVAVTWRIMGSKKGHKMMVRGYFQVERSNTYMYERLQWSEILMIIIPSGYWSNSDWGIQLTEELESQ